MLKSSSRDRIFRVSRTAFCLAIGAATALIPASFPAGADQPAGTFASSPNEFMVVDCRLPGRVRKLGTSMIYQMPGNVIRTTAHDCEIRGGEYTLLDPSSYAHAIKLWIGAAESGDVKAQTNVAMLYEKINPPNYAAAAKWYQKAASAGYAPAEAALARLYEAGLGVPQDKVKAVNLYRRAAGIKGSLLEYIETPSAGMSGASSAQQNEIRALRKELKQKQDDLDRLHRSLRQIENHSSNARPGPGSQKEVAALHRRIASLKRQLKQVPAGASDLTDLPPPKVEIVYPLATRGIGGVELRMRAEKGAGDIVGRVHSEIGVRRLTVGKHTIPVDDQLLFAVPRRLLSSSGPTKITVTDLLGRTSSIEVMLKPPSPTPPNINASFSGQKYYALVIGDDNFEYWPHIDNAVNDARAVAQVLRTHYGFKTTLLLNATRRQILSAFNNLRKLTPDDNLLIYYAGHGQLVPQIDRGYWIPVNARERNDTEWILNEQITDYLQIIPARHIIVIADSCYAGVLTRSSVQIPKSGLASSTRLKVLEQLSPKRVRTVMTSGGVQPVLDSGVNGHSVFANALLRVLRNNDNLLEGERLFDAVSPIVIAQSEKLGYKQTPTYRAIVFAGHEGGDFLFVPSSKG